ncbi:protein LEKR1 isoform X2 [Alosa alosa]|uniref:protein LEKR1 isoform X2 n=1 Tax=Alosa alosa TaxID=278164 RepID=UPI0020155289|nr:protein LEKR1 isoform X2 [Alosa alosa]
MVMERSETECQYCGVSYLILHEFQRLQQRLAEAERSLDELRGAAERERRLRTELEEATATHSLLQDRERILGQQLAEVTQALELVRGERDLHHRQLDHEQAQRRTLSMRCKRQQQALLRSGCVLRSSHQELQTLRTHLSHLKAFWEDQNGKVVQSSTAAMADLLKLQQVVGSKQEELGRLQGEVLELEACLSSSRQQVRSLQELSDRQQEELRLAQEAHIHVQRMKEEVRSVNLNLQKSQSDCKHIEEQLQTRSREIEELRSGQIQCEREQRTALQRLSQDLREKEASWLSCQQRCDAFQEQLLAWQRRQEELTRRLRRAEGESATRGEALQQAADRTAAMETQRQEMSEAHGREVQRLEESFRRMLQEAEQERTQIQAALEQQRAQVGLQLKEREVELRREAAMDLDIERHKNQELLSKYQQEKQLLQLKLPSLVQSATQELQREVVALEERLEEARLRLAQQEHRREEEAQCLREEARALERQLAQERSASQAELQGAQQSHQQRALQLAEALRELEQLRSHSAALQEETELLQETVRRECEEREGLTAALTEAREQLLQLRRPAPDPSSSAPNVPQRPSPPRLTATFPSPRGPWAGSRERRSAASWHGPSQSHSTPTLPRLTGERPSSSASEAHRRIALLMSRNGRV